MTYDRNIPYNNLPLLPPPEEALNDIAVLKDWGFARSALSKLDGITSTLEDPTLMVNTIALQEAKESSRIENIVTTTDTIYETLTLSAEDGKNSAAKEVLRYRDALNHGLALLKSDKSISDELIIGLFQSIKQSTAGYRTDFQEVWLKAGGTGPGAGKRVYTPPIGSSVIASKVTNLLTYLNDNKRYNDDPLMKMVVSHYQFEAIHPFIDGNGRAGRILNVLYLIDQGLLSHPIAYFSRYIVRNKEEYYYLLKRVTEAGAWKPWLRFMFEVVRSTSLHAIDKIEAINKLRERTIQFVRERDRKIGKEYLEAIFIHPYIKALHLSENDRYPISNRKTATNILNKLVDLGVLNPPKKIGRETVYINENLIQLLSEDGF